MQSQSKSLYTLLNHDWPVDSEIHMAKALEWPKQFWKGRTILKVLNYLSSKLKKKQCCCSVAKSCPILCDPMNCSMPGFPVLQHFPQFAQAHAHWVSDAIQPSHPLLPPSSLALNLSQHQGLFQWVSCSLQVTKVLELQIQHQSSQWTSRVDFL